MIRKNVINIMLLTLLIPFVLPLNANLLLNPSFESWSNLRIPTDWTVEDTTYTKIYKDSVRVFHGSYAVKMQRFQVGTGNNKGILQRVTIPGRGRYVASMRYYLTSDSVKGGLTITWRNASAGFISSWSTEYTETIPSPTWRVVRRAALSDTAPLNAVYADFIIRTYGLNANTPSGGTIFVDSVSFLNASAIEEQGDERARNQLRFEINPNPFFNQTQIKFSIDLGKLQALKIYDATGKLVKTITSVNKIPDHYTVVWTGDNEKGELVSPGIYFIALETQDGQKQIKKTLFLK